VRNYWFEIVRRTYDRYSWVFVEDRNGRRRVLARSERDYRSKKRVKRAIARIQDVLGDADVFDATDPLDLPDVSFERTPDALPLLVGKRPGHYARAKARQGGFADRRPAAAEAEGAPAAGAEAPTAAAEAAPTAAAEAAPTAAAEKTARDGATKKDAGGAAPSRRGSRSSPRQASQKA
jgi:hypothetical protein